MTTQGKILYENRRIGAGVQYRITVGPGRVRYMFAKEFFGADIESVVAEIECEAGDPKIEADGLELLERFGNLDWVKFQFWDVIKMVRAAPWRDQLRVHHALGVQFLNRGMPSFVYPQFHRLLQLGTHFAVAECVDAWVEGTATDRDLARSYQGSSQHLVVEIGTFEHAVFKITPFVCARIEALLAEKKLKDEEAAKLAAEAAAAEETRLVEVHNEALRRSRFDTYVYLIEDTRNGLFKIGRSKTPSKRERTLQSEVPTTVLRFWIPAEEVHEKALHTRFASQRLRGEWFQLTPALLADAIKFLKTNGDAERVSADFAWLGKLLFQAQ